MVERFYADRDSITAPAHHGLSITKSDTTVLEPATRYLMVTGAGTVKVTMAGQVDAESVTLTLSAGIMYPLAVSKVWSTGTAATGIFGFY